MNKISKNQKGFGSVEALLILIILILIGVVGYMVYKNHHKTTTASVTTTAKTSKSTATANPYAGWHSHELKYEKASFKYPATWTLKDSSFTSSANAGGNDDVALTGTNGFEMKITDGGPNDYGFPAGGLALVYADPIKFLGQSDFFDLAEAGPTNTNAVDYINLTTSNSSLTAFPSDKNVVSPNLGGATQDKFLILMDYNADVNTSSSNPTYPSYTSSQVLNDPNYKDARLIVESFSY